MMAERVIFTAVRDELALYTDPADNGQRYKAFLIKNVELSEDEAEKARVFFAGGTYNGETFEAQPPKLTHGYPRQGGPWPQWALTLGGEQEVEHYLGDDGEPLDEEGNAYFDEDGVPAESKVKRVRYTYNFLVIVDHPDLTLYHYHLLKHLLLRRTRYLIKNDLDNLQLSGADMAPDPRYLPHDVFARVLTVMVDTDECWVEPLDGGVRANKVGGIHTDDSGAGVTVGEGSVKAKVTPNTGA